LKMKISSWRREHFFRREFFWLGKYCFIIAHRLTSLNRIDAELQTKRTFYLFIYLFIYFGGTGVWAQGFALTSQALYFISHASRSFWSGYFGDRVSLLPRLAWISVLLIYTFCSCWDDRYASSCPAFSCWDRVSWTFFFGTCNHNPPNLSLPSS
jgi:hypothetical protein